MPRTSPLTLLIAILLSLSLASASPDFPTQHDLISRTVSNATFDERSGILTLPSSSSFDASKRWFSASVGMMIERSPPGFGTEAKMKRRSSSSSSRQTRDIHSEEVTLGLDKRGNFVWPDSFEEVSKLAKRARHAGRKKVKKAKKAGRKAAKKMTRKAKNSSLAVKLAASIPKFLATITWYTGHDLQNPYCAQKSGWTPSDGSMIAAVTEQWGKDRPDCGSFLQLRAPKANKAIVVRVVDLCGGCKPGVAHVDLSIAAFKAMYDLNVGLVTDIEVSTLSGTPVTGGWTDNLKKMYGPQDL